MNPSETVIVMASGLSGVAMFCSGLLTGRGLMGVAGLGIYLAVWAYSLYRVSTDYA